MSVLGGAGLGHTWDGSEGVAERVGVAESGLARQMIAAWLPGRFVPGLERLCSQERVGLIWAEIRGVGQWV
jgi:hypothetical protein